MEEITFIKDDSTSDKAALVIVKATAISYSLAWLTGAAVYFVGVVLLGAEGWDVLGVLLLAVIGAGIVALIAQFSYGLYRIFDVCKTAKARFAGAVGLLVAPFVAWFLTQPFAITGSFL